VLSFSVLIYKPGFWIIGGAKGNNRILVAALNGLVAVTWSARVGHGGAIRRTRVLGRVIAPLQLRQIPSVS
jgi:hypothetical protein